MGSDRIAGAYARFRGSRLFLIVLTAVILFWVIWNSIPGLPHFDGDGFGRLNLLLSSEASISVALLIMANDKQDHAQSVQQKYMLHLLEAVRESLVNANAGKGSPETGSSSSAGVAGSN